MTGGPYIHSKIPGAGAHGRALGLLLESGSPLARIHAERPMHLQLDLDGDIVLGPPVLMERDPGTFTCTPADWRSEPLYIFGAHFDVRAAWIIDAMGHIHAVGMKQAVRLGRGDVFRMAGTIALRMDSDATSKILPSIIKKKPVDLSPWTTVTGAQRWP